MKNEEFLQLLSGIDEKLIEKAGEDLENYHKAATQYAAGGSSRKKLWKRITAAVCAAAVMAGVVVFVKNVGNIRGESSGVVLSGGGASMPELPIISKPKNTESEPQDKPLAYFNFSLHGDTDTGNYQFTSALYKNSSWTTPAEVSVYRGNINERNSAVISVYSEDCLDYPGECLTDYQVVDHFSTREDRYHLNYDTRYFEPFSDDSMYLCAETGDEFVTFEGEWTP